MMKKQQTLQDALLATGINHYEQGELEKAIAVFEQLALKFEKNAGAHNNLAVIYKQRQQYEQALHHYQAALAIQPDNAGFQSNYANALRLVGKIEMALQYHQQAVALEPNHLDHHYNLALSLRDNLQLEQAIAKLKWLLAKQPGQQQIIWDLALSELLAGDFLNGFHHYQARWQLPEISSYGANKPLWQGESLKDKIILVCHEQGYGDTLQFVRLVPQLCKLAAQVKMLCQPQLGKLFVNSFPNIQFVSHPKATGKFDYYIHLLDLPIRQQLDLQHIPQQVPYLTPCFNPELQTAIDNQLQKDKLHIGINWCGKPSFANNHLRSMSLQQLLPLLKTEQVQWVNLHKGAAEVELAENDSDINVINLMPLCQDFNDGAQLMQHLDLVISTCTGTVHLAGALNIPTWVMLPFTPDWRWLLKRTDSPWYPSIKLFRQAKPRDWQSVVAPVYEALQQYLQKKH